MKKAACIAVCFVMANAVSVDGDSPLEELHRLRAENRLLKAQVESLKRRLAAATSKPATGPKTQPTTGPATSTGPATQGQASGAVRITIVLHEQNPKWWEDPVELAKEVAAREVVGKLKPEHALETWLARNKWLVGKEVKWKLKVSECETLTEVEAGGEYFRVLKRKKSVEVRLAKYKSGGYVGSKAALARAIANAERQMREYESQAAQCKALMDAKGGTLITLKVRQPAEITVTLAVPGGKRTPRGKMVDVSGRIVAAARGTSSGSLRLAVIAH